MVRVHWISSFFFFFVGDCNIWKAHEATESLDETQLDHPAIVCDAGSTGSRIFAFYVLKQDSSDGTEKVSVELMGRSGIGLSEFAKSGTFDEATKSIAPFISKGIKRLGPNVPIYVFATGGVRQLPQELRQRLWEHLRVSLPSSFPDHAGRIDLQILDGDDEAFFGLLSANYLVNDVPLGDIKGPLTDPVGVLDLGGSSLEVAVAGDDRIVGSHDDVLISFTGLGLRKVWDRLIERNATTQCLFEVGNGVECRKVIRELITNDSDFVSKRELTNLDRVNKFVGISAFAYAMDFAYWVMSMKTPTALSAFSLEYPSPSVTSMRSACDIICSYPYLDALFRQHQFTTSREVPERCFNICYVSEVLSLLLESRINERIVHFLVQVSLTHFVTSILLP